MDIDQLKQASEGKDGVWLGSDIHGLDGVELCVRSMVHPDVVRDLSRRKRQALRTQGSFENEGFDPSSRDTIEDETVARVAIVDWKGLTHKGEPLPYSPDMAVELMALPPFWYAVRACSNEATKRDTTAMESLVGNSRAPSREVPPAA